MKYRDSKNQYNTDVHLSNLEILECIITIFEKEDVNVEILIDIINTLADFIQYNNKYYFDFETFEKLADLIVGIIGKLNDEHNEFNINNQNDIKDIKKLLENFKMEIFNDFKINIYFYGKDKYNLLNKSINKNISIIEDISELRKIQDSKKNDQINILILSEETVDINLDLGRYFDDIIYYDKLMNYMFNMSENIYYKNYDYNYLLKSLEKSESKEIDTIVVGNSYPLTGIDTNLLKFNSVNLSLSSQDLYYSYKLAKLAIRKNENIKRCIIGAGYYLVNHDLSKSKNEYSINMIKNVYYPLLKDKHNSDKVESIEILSIASLLNDNTLEYIFDLDFLDRYFKDLIYRDNNGYFNKNFTRNMNSMLGGVKLKDIIEEDKNKLGKLRSEQHNKLSKYTKTTYEYSLIFNEFMEFLSINNIEVVIVVFPTTKYYSKFLDEKYEYEFYKIVETIKEKFEVTIVDFSKSDIFIEDDFIDFDHISEIGSCKITQQLNNIIAR